MFRGCVTFGEHIAEDSFLLGQAVDEAASVAESTEGAFIWLTPKAQALLRGYDQYRLTTSSAMLRKQPPNDAIAAVNAIIEMQERFESQSVYPDETRKNRIWWRKLNEQQQQKVAAEILWELTMAQRRDQIIADYPMEMKGGGHLLADVVNPLIHIQPAKYGEWIERMLSGFGDAPLDVLIKKQNTARFLNTASKISKESVSEAMTAREAARSRLAKATGILF